MFREDGIHLVLPTSLAYRKLIPTFTYDGGSITVANVPQVSGVTPQFFMNELLYKVKGEDGIEVTIPVRISSDPNISLGFVSYFLLREQNPSLNSTVGFKMENDTLRATVRDYNGSKTLIPSYESPGSKLFINGVEQVSGVTPVDFSGPVIYQVTAGGFKNTIPVKVNWQ